MQTFTKALQRAAFQQPKQRVLFQISSASQAGFATKSHFYDLLQLEETRADLREMVEKFADDEVKPIAEEMDQSMVFPREMWKKLGDMGLLGVTVEQNYGGAGLGYYEHCIVTEELSKANGGLGLSYLAHSNLAVNQIRLNGNEDQKRKYLPGLIDGDLVGSLAMSEPNSGSDVVSMQMNAKKVGNKYVLNGSKMWITNGPSADVVVVYAKTDKDAAHKGISTFIVEKGTPGFSVAQKLDKLGMRGSETGELVFEDCEIPEENLMGNEGEGVYILMKGLDYERLILSAGALGIAQAALDASLEYASDRKQFNSPLISKQIIQAKLADMYTQVQASRALLYQGATMFDAGLKSNTDSSAIYLHNSRAAVSVADECIQIFGGNGYINEYPCGRFWRDAKLYDIGGGTKEIRQWLIGRELEKIYK